MWRRRMGSRGSSRRHRVPERARILLLAQVAHDHAVEPSGRPSRRREGRRGLEDHLALAEVFRRHVGEAHRPGGRRCGRRVASERRASHACGKVAIEIRTGKHQHERHVGTGRLEPCDGVGAAPRVQGDGDIGRFAVPLALYNRLRDPGEESRPAPGGAPVAVVGFARAGRHDERHGLCSGRTAHAERNRLAHGRLAGEPRVYPLDVRPTSRVASGRCRSSRS